MIRNDNYYILYINYKVQQGGIPKCDKVVLQSATAILLQSATSVITKCDRHYKVRYKVRQMLQSAMLLRSVTVHFTHDQKLLENSHDISSSTLQVHGLELVMMTVCLNS